MAASKTKHEQQLATRAQYLSPINPIRTIEFLRGRTAELETLEQELRFFHGVPFIFGNRGVGKTSLARTVAQLVTLADREHIYVACAPGATMLDIFRQIGVDLLGFAMRFGNCADTQKKLEINLSLNPSIKLSIESRSPQLPPFDSVNTAVRTLHEIDGLVPNAQQTVIIIDELESLTDTDRKHLAFLVKQTGDQEFGVRFVLVGIAENVHELIGATASIYVALYFVVSRCPDKDGAVYVVHAHTLLQAMKKAHAALADIPTEDYNYQDPAAPSVLYFFHQRFARVDRMIAQQGLFLMSRNVASNVEEVLAEEVPKAADPDKITLLKLRIPAGGEKPGTMRRLRSMNVTASSLFPGLDGIGREFDELIRNR